METVQFTNAADGLIPLANLAEPIDDRGQSGCVVGGLQHAMQVRNRIVPGRHHAARGLLRGIPGRRHIGVRSGEQGERVARFEGTAQLLGHAPLESSASFDPLQDFQEFELKLRATDIDRVQYGSDDTKTHRKIKHILGAAYHDRVGRLLVSELFTVGAGGWSGFPSHKHDTDRLPDETRHDECYNFRFRPDYGSGLQMLQRVDNEPGDAYHIVNRSTVLIDKGYHPCCVLPGYEMYYFTILGGQSQRSLKQYFQPTHAAQLHTIPGIMDMVAKFK